MADPGFPVGGGVDLVAGGVDSRGGYVSKILYVKTKELGPLGGGRAPGAPPPLDPPMLSCTIVYQTCFHFVTRYSEILFIQLNNAIGFSHYGTNQ